MALTRIPAAFIRGGTSKAVVFRRDDLPADRSDWEGIFLAAMGSPDPQGRQLDGMGGGISSLSKVCVVGRCDRSDADVEYTFAQIGVADATVDYSANCGNMSSAIGPFAMDEGLIIGPRSGPAAVRILNTNTGKIIVSRFEVVSGVPVTEGDLAIDGVAGTGAPVRLEFLDPGGAGTGQLLPTGRQVDRLDVVGVGALNVTLVDAANPCAFVSADDLGLTGDESPDALEADPDLLARLEAVRCAASVAMGLAPDIAAAGRIPSIPKIAVVYTPRPMTTLSGRRLRPDEMTLGVRMISIGRPHRALPVTGGICLAVATRIAGTVPARLARTGDGPITLGHPSGLLVVDAEVDDAETPQLAHARFGALYRTQRRLFEGSVVVPSRVLAEGTSRASEVAA